MGNGISLTKRSTRIHVLLMLFYLGRCLRLFSNSSSVTSPCSSFWGKNRSHFAAWENETLRLLFTWDHKGNRQRARPKFGLLSPRSPFWPLDLYFTVPVGLVCPANNLCSLKETWWVKGPKSNLENSLIKYLLFRYLLSTYLFSRYLLGTCLFSIYWILEDRCKLGAKIWMLP